MRVKSCDGKRVSNLISGVEYTVIAIYLTEPLKAMIYVESLPSAPFSVCLDDVEVVDSRLSSYWRYGPALPETEKRVGRPPILAFPEWVDDHCFFQNIVDSVGDAGNVWRKYLEKMEREYASKDVTRASIDLGDGWLQCIECCDAWLPNSQGESVTCPSCLTVQLRAS